MLLNNWVPEIKWIDGEIVSLGILAKVEFNASKLASSAGMFLKSK